MSDNRMNKYIPFLGILLLVLVLMACGETGWDMVIPSAGTYQVSARADELSLDSCSLVGRTSDVYPYFKNSLVNDPDVRGLVVFLRDSQGEQVSGKFHYSLVPESGVDPAVEDEVPEEKSDETPVEEVQTDEPSIESLVTFIQVPRLDQRLPAFIIPEELPMGYYTLVFQVLGEKDVLYRTEKSIYYIADAEFEFTDLQSYLPDVLGGGRLPSPGDNVLLEALINADERLTPYVIWYSGKQNIAEGYVSEGAARFMWEIPEQPLFHTIRAEVFPIMPDERNRRSITGKTKELLFPVSTKNDRKKNVAEDPESFTHWYDFGGTLQDVNNLGESKYDLIPLGTTAPNWKPYAGLYGLSIAPGEQYEIPVSFTALNQNEQGHGRLKLHLAPLGQGGVLDLYLNLTNSSEAVHINVSLAEAGLVLSLEAGADRYETILEGDGENYSSLLFDYTFNSQDVAVGLSLNNTTVSLELDLSELSASLTGTGVLRLGSGVLPTPDNGAAAGNEGTIVIINELRTNYAVSPWEPENLIDEAVTNQETL
jgi:hypothetical protein